MRTLRNVTLILAMAALSMNMVVLFAHWTLAYWSYDGRWRPASPVGLDIWSALLSPLPWQGLSYLPATTAVGLAVVVGVATCLRFTKRAAPDGIRRLALFAMALTVGTAALAAVKTMAMLELHPVSPPRDEYRAVLAELLSTLRFGAMVSAGIAICAWRSGRTPRPELDTTAGRTDVAALAVLLLTGLAYSIHSYNGSQHLIAYTVTYSEYMAESLMFSWVLLVGMVTVVALITAGAWPGAGATLARLAGAAGLAPGFFRRGPLGMLAVVSVWISALIGLALLLGFGNEWARARTDFDVFLSWRFGFVVVCMLLLGVFTAVGVVLAILLQFSPADRRGVAFQFPWTPVLFGSAAPAALALCLAVQAHALIDTFAQAARLGRAVNIHDFPEVPQSILALQAALILSIVALATAAWLHRLLRGLGRSAPSGDA